MIRFGLTSAILVVWYITFGNGPDFAIYYHAGLGDLTFHVKHYTWVYKDFLQYLFVPWTWLPYQESAILWHFIQIICCAVMSYKIENLYAYLLCIPGFVFCIWAGNIYPLLALASFSPWGIILACLVKPHFAFIGLVMALARTYRARNERPAIHRPDSHSTPRVLDV